MLQISHRLFKKASEKSDISIGEAGEYGIAQLFLPQDELNRNQAKKMLEIIVQKEGMKFLGFREVPVHAQGLGHKAKEGMPHIMQAFITRRAQVATGLEFDRRRDIARRICEQRHD